METIKNLFVRLRGLLRLYWGYCPKCNSSAPETDRCSVCGGDTGLPAGYSKRRLWWLRFRMELAGGSPLRIPQVEALLDYLDERIAWWIRYKEQCTKFNQPSESELTDLFLHEHNQMVQILRQHSQSLSCDLLKVIDAHIERVVEQDGWFDKEALISELSILKVVRSAVIDPSEAMENLRSGDSPAKTYIADNNETNMINTILLPLLRAYVDEVNAWNICAKFKEQYFQQRLARKHEEQVRAIQGLPFKDLKAMIEGSYEKATEPEFYIWSDEHGSWWKPSATGYTSRLDRAGKYSFGEAIEICNQANLFLDAGEKPNECMVPVPTHRK